MGKVQLNSATQCPAPYTGPPAHPISSPAQLFPVMPLDTDAGSAFKNGEEVLCYWNNKLYNAKCQDRTILGDGTVCYKVHYIGWKKSRDEVVSVDRCDG